MVDIQPITCCCSSYIFIFSTEIISEDNLDAFIAEDQDTEVKRTWKTAQRVQQEILKLLRDDTKEEPSIPRTAAKDIFTGMVINENPSLTSLFPFS